MTPEAHKHRLKTLLKANRPEGVGWRRWQKSVDECIDTYGCDWLVWLLDEYGNLATAAIESAIVTSTQARTRVKNEQTQRD